MIIDEFVNRRGNVCSLRTVIKYFRQKMFRIIFQLENLRRSRKYIYENVTNKRS